MGYLANSESGGEFETFVERMVEYFSSAETWMHFLFILMQIIIIYVLGRILIRISNKALIHFMRTRDRSPLKIDPRRRETIARLSHNVISYAINFIMILMILSQLGMQLAPILAGAGVIGLAVGFGAQSLVKDVISGFFIIFEDQFAVGDTVEIGNYRGTVEQIGLRITRVRSDKGELHVIPNGTIGQMSNLSVYNSTAIIDVSVSYKSDIQQTLHVIQEAADRIHQDNENILKRPEVLGIQSIASSAMTIRVTCECKPQTIMEVTRQLNAELKATMDAKGIELIKS